MYYKMLIPKENVIDFCDGCDCKIFGEKMLSAIKKIWKMQKKEEIFSKAHAH